MLPLVAVPAAKEMRFSYLRGATHIVRGGTNHLHPRREAGEDLLGIGCRPRWLGE